MKIKLKERKIKDGMISLYLEYYKGYSVKPNGKTKHFRSQEKLNLYYPEFPKNKQEKDLKKEVLQTAEMIVVKRQADINDENFGFLNKRNQSINFIGYMEKIINELDGSYKHNWTSALKHLILFNQSDYLPFKSIDVKFLNGFKEYLIKEPVVNSIKPLSTNSVQSYFNKIRIALKKAFDEKLINENIAMKVKSVKGEDTSREYLTIEEIQKMANTECRYESLKKAFLFSCITGLRWSDVNNLKWKDIEKNNGKYRILFRQRKTKGYEYLDITNQALELMGNEKEPEERVFKGLRYSAYFNTELLRWALKSGITKHITFHSARHSFATMLLTTGTDLYTVSKLLGHKNISTTQIYAKIIDSKKQEAMNKIPELNYKKTNNISENK